MAARNQVYRITSAQTGLTIEQAGRTRRYLISMAIRTVCFLGAVVTDGWLRWLLVLGAVVLPYLAVVVANAGRERTKDTLPTVFVHHEQVALPSQAVQRTDANDGSASAGTTDQPSHPG
jgi:hypothetical protein